MNHIFEFIHVSKLYKLIFFSLARKFCQIMYTNVFNNHSPKIITRYQWSHEFLLLKSFFCQNLSLRLNINTEASLRRFLLRECFVKVQPICGQEPVQGLISIELHMQLCGDHSSAWVVSCGLCFAFAEHFFGGIIASGYLLLSKHLSLITQFL